MDISIKSSRVVMATDSAKKLKELKLAEDSENSFKNGSKNLGAARGYSYEMFFDTEKFEGDSVEEYEGVNIVDSESTTHIQGATLDYKEGLMETVFLLTIQMFSRTCGCGNSFS